MWQNFIEALQRLRLRFFNAGHDIWATVRGLTSNALTIIGVLASIMAWGLLLVWFPYILGPVLGLFFGGMLILFALPWLPFSLEPFMIRPNKKKGSADEHGRYEMDRSGFFTDLQPGRVKVKTTWNGSFITMLMDWDNRRFEGEDPGNSLTPDQHGYWRVVPSGELPDSHPLPFPAPKGALISADWWLWVAYSPFSIIWWLWKRQVYRLNGAVWVGVPGFRTLRIYPLDRLVVRNKDDATRELVHKWDYSDHYRVGDFQIGIKVPRADTQNMMPLNVEFNEIGRVTNPFLAAFNTDDQWPMRFSGAGTDSITAFTRSKPAREVIAAADITSANAMGVFITQNMTRLLEEVGIEVVQSQYIDVSTVNKDDEEALAEPARADAYRQGKELRAKGDAAPIREIGQAMREFPEAQEIPRIEGRIRAVQAAGDRAMIFFGEERAPNPLDAAQLAELRRLNTTLTPPTEGSTS